MPHSQHGLAVSHKKNTRTIEITICDSWRDEEDIWENEYFPIFHCKKTQLVHASQNQFSDSLEIN